MLITAPTKTPQVTPKNHQNRPSRLGGEKLRTHTRFLYSIQIKTSVK